jgi:hypothetical protein
MLAGKIGYFRQSFTPRSLANLEGWWDASVQSSVTLNGSTVSSWQDLSGNARHANQATAANQPTYSATRNSLRVVSFDGATQFLRGAWPVTLTAQTTFAVVSITAPNGYGRIFTQTTTTNGTATGTANADFSISGHYIPLLRYLDTAQVVSWRQGSFRASVDSAPLGRWDIFSSVYSGTVISNAINNGTPATYSGVALNTSFHTFGIGAAIPPSPGNTTNTGGWFAGQIGEVISYSRALSSGERAQVAAYLRRKWATP